MLKLAERRQARLSLKPAVTPEPSGEPQTAAAPASQPATSPREVTAVTALVQHLAELGVEQAFGVSGGAIALLFDAIADSSLDLCHFRHETGAAFAATEAHFASGKPTAVFATTGPGLLNALTGITAARWDGAKVILLSGATSSPQRGRWATQETSAYTLPQDALYGQGPIFDYAVRVEHASELTVVARRLRQGMSRAGGFVAHVCLPMSIQASRISGLPAACTFGAAAPTAPKDEVAHIADRLKNGTFGIWAGFGATAAAPLVRELAERASAHVFCSPRGKGIMPENHPLYLGVTGLGGHSDVTDFMYQHRPDRLLVLGTRLGEATSFWDRDMVPAKGFVHVDIDPEVPGAAYPDAETHAVQAEIEAFLRDLLEHFPRPNSRAASLGDARASAEPVPLPVAGQRPVRPQVLMSALQRLVVRDTDAPILAECGNSFAWCNHYLRFPTAGRYRVSTLFGSMGHAAAGVVGAALARGGKAVAVTGDGSMLMNSELSSAAQYGAQAVWVVLNDAGYGMCRDGHRALGLTSEEVGIPQVDFATYAKSVGADGLVVESEDQLDDALALALAAPGPFVVDVRIDASEASPLLKRFESLIKQGSSKNVAGWEARD
ncbi:MAG: thiamine pyrophosphate-dependent enzyme [Acidobacteriota bacterium]